MVISHTASMCLLQNKRKSGWFKHKEDQTTKTAQMLSKIRIDLRTVDIGGRGRGGLPDVTCPDDIQQRGISELGPK